MPLHKAYSPLLVILSVLIASAASYTALDLAGRVTAARGRERLAWLTGGSLAMGVGIWSMHFVGMLAFHLPVPIGYQLGRVLLSVLVAIAASALALVVVSRPKVSLPALAVGAMWMGPAIAGMHYIGMAALNVPATMRFDVALVVTSVGIAIVASFVGLTLAHRFRLDEGAGGFARRMASGLVMGLAIAGMHYTGMAAAQFTVPGRTGASVGGLLATRDLAIGVTLGALVILTLGIFGATVDRWLRRRAQSAELKLQSQKLEAIGQLAGGIAHDFNNLLTAILGNAAFVLESTPPDDPRHDDVREIERAAARAAELTHQLLAFSRKQVLRPTSLDLNAALAQIMRMLTRLVGEHIEVTVLPEPALGRVQADAAQLEQVIVNLVVNARDAMPDGGRLTIETQNVTMEAGSTSQHIGAPPGAYVLIAFTDTGIGMDPAIQKRIFEPFFTTKERGKGTGLGLATVYGIVKQSGGSISVYSEPNRGSTFKVYLPRVAEPVPTTGEDAAQPVSTSGTETVLIVEDEEAVRLLAVRTLLRRGYTTLVARDGEEALRASEQHPGPIHLLLTDVVLPRTSGPKLAASLIAARPELRVLYMSGFTENAIVHHGVLDPDTEFIQKPFSPQALALKVQEVLRKVAAGRPTGPGPAV
jgi:NO-binding membrane sensor protein with MHYT domain/nitrogen-specific signal transduction histidine kinase/ActR/RegA family two-component response regulator